MTALVLGIDGGGSKTLIALADGAGNVLRLSKAGGLNPLDNHNWRQALETQLQPFAGTAGLAGIAAALPVHGEVKDISAEQREAIASVFGAIPQLVLNDVDAAHIGAFGGASGILILSGTGSMAWARDSAGRSSRVGGWGDVIGDEGSSYWIGRRILARVSEALDGRAAHTALTGALLDQIGGDPAEPANSVVGWVATLTDPRAQIAALAPLATRLSELGDDAATAIIADAAHELARHHSTIAKLTGLADDWTYAGGAFRSHALSDAVAIRIGRPPLSPILPPIGGALLAAAQLADWPADKAWIEQLAASLQVALHPDHEPQLTN